MSNSPIKLPNGQKVGYIETKSSGEMVGKLANGQTVGTYNPKTNKTKKANGQDYGTGNLLSALIMQGHH
jgi:hypothetical protein